MARKRVQQNDVNERKRVPAHLDVPTGPTWLLKYGSSDPDGDTNKERVILCVLDSLADGASLTQACKAAGKSHTTFWRWENEDPRLKAARDIAEGRSYIDAVRSLRAAMREVRHDPRLWTAVMTFLERRHPDEFGKIDRLSIQQDGPVSHTHTVVYGSDHATPPLESAWTTSGPTPAPEISSPAGQPSDSSSSRTKVGQDDSGD